MDYYSLQSFNSQFKKKKNEKIMIVHYSNE